MSNNSLNKLNYNSIRILKVFQIFTSQLNSSNIFWITIVTSILPVSNRKSFETNLLSIKGIHLIMTVAFWYIFLYWDWEHDAKDQTLHDLKI
ncbi:hypothetical protein BpHYR1_021551 [Brachionus plicatilis]|uniref:Uncharacterized protein n=1 Tax=Brachionus plicatilis TaxID=10195 RepID=A0A3M7SYF6_BRAPC|nr:hypothetical protein BpHYR1_021551 [Brachionus plicatilis]